MIALRDDLAADLHDAFPGRLGVLAAYFGADRLEALGWAKLPKAIKYGLIFGDTLIGVWYDDVEEAVKARDNDISAHEGCNCGNTYSVIGVYPVHQNGETT